MFSIALRMAVRNPVLSLSRIAVVAAVVTVAGAITAVADATLRPLPVPEPDRFVEVLLLPPGTAGVERGIPLYPIGFLRLRETPGPFERVEGLSTSEQAIGGITEPHSVPAAAASAGLVPLLGGTVVHGRLFTEAEEAEGIDVVVLSYGLWQRRFGGDPSVIGKTLLIDRVPHEIIGVTAANFPPKFVTADIWTPLHVPPSRLAERASVIRTFARLQHGVSTSQTRSSLDAGMRALTAEAPAMFSGFTYTVAPVSEVLFGRQRSTTLLLLTAVLALGVLAAANLANLTLADVMGRRTEIATRVALGGETRDVLSPELALSTFLGLVGGGVGLLVAYLLLPGLQALDSGPLANADITVNWLVAALSVGLALLVMSLATLVPILRVLRQDVQQSLRRSSRGSVGALGSRRMRAWMVGVQVAVGLTLMTITGQVLASYSRATSLDPGFDNERLVATQVRLPPTTYSTPGARTAFVQQLVDEVARVPGIASVGATTHPLLPNFPFMTLAEIEGQPTANGEPHTVGLRRVFGDYFRTMGIRLIDGRFLNTSDSATGLPVVVVSESLRQRHWPGQSALGKRLRRITPNVQWLTVVGVVGDVYDVGFGQPIQDTLYIPYAQNNNAGAPVTLVSRTIGEPEQSMKAIAMAIRDVDPLQPVAKQLTVDDFLQASLGPVKLRALLLLSFATLAVVIVAVGTFSMTVRSVGERTREIGLRLALGGTPLHIWRTVTGHTLVAVTLGLFGGTLVSFFVVRELPRFIQDVTPAYGLLLVAFGTLFAIAGLAAALAAARAARLSPLRALRAD